MRWKKKQWLFNRKKSKLGIKLKEGQVKVKWTLTKTNKRWNKNAKENKTIQNDIDKIVEVKKKKKQLNKRNCEDIFNFYYFFCLWKSSSSSTTSAKQHKKKQCRYLKQQKI